jgi:hypothetical protein
VPMLAKRHRYTFIRVRDIRVNNTYYETLIRNGGGFLCPEESVSRFKCCLAKIRITFPAGSCTVVLRYCLAKFTSIRIWGMLFGKIGITNCQTIFTWLQLRRSFNKTLTKIF